MLHGIYSIDPPPAISGHEGEDLIAQKKLESGDGYWAFQKRNNGMDHRW